MAMRRTRQLSLSSTKHRRDAHIRWLAGTAIRIATGTVLLTAAGAKVGIARSGVIAPTDYLLSLRAGCEAVFGLVCLLGIMWQQAHLVATLIFSLFSCITFHEAIMGLPSCGCFGAIKVNPWYTFGFDVLMVLGLAATASPREVVSGPLSVVSRWNVRRGGWSIASLCGVALIGVGIQAAYARGQIEHVGSEQLAVGSGDSGKIVILEPLQWIGKRLPILSSVDVKDQIATGDWTVVLYHSDCPACREAMPRFERQARSGAPVATIEMPPYAAAESELVPLSSACVRGRLSDKREWFATTPVVLTLRDGIVQSAREGGEQVVMR